MLKQREDYAAFKFQPLLLRHGNINQSGSLLSEKPGSVLNGNQHPTPILGGLLRTGTEMALVSHQLSILICAEAVSQNQTIESRNFSFSTS